MNVFEFDVVNNIARNGYTNQRLIAEKTNFSLGKVNDSIKVLIEDNYLSKDLYLTEKAIKEINEKRPKNAVILAAGYGLRMAPINSDLPKGLINVKGDVLIERIINQLHEVGIYDIDIIVGYMKEKFEYLIQKYGVNLVYNADYAKKNNLYSLKLVINKISNTYIIPCHVWVDKNPFSQQELYSWYAISDILDDNSYVRLNRKRELTTVEVGQVGNMMIGIAYLLEEQAFILRKKIKELCLEKKYDKCFWEDALFDKSNKLIIYAKEFKAEEVYEITTYEQLREVDDKSKNLDSSIIRLISNVLNVNVNEIKEITLLKKGMTNRSFLFTCKDKRYIMRIPGEGTDKLINRVYEFKVYEKLRGSDICDKVIYIDDSNGYKITKYWEDARVCDPLDFNDVKRCMNHLRSFHNLKITVEHTFDLFQQIEFYENLWEGQPSIFDDYSETKQNIFKLKDIINATEKEWTLTHIDAIPDNFLFIHDSIKLIDWEYAGMQDPHVDIAMFAIYSLYDREQIDRLIQCYFPEGCKEVVKKKIYCYIAVCGLLWSNWCEYKRLCGVEFGEYSLRQYHYAKKYYSIVINEFHH